MAFCMMLSVCYTERYLIETEGNDGENEAGSNHNDDNEAEYGDYAKKKDTDITTQKPIGGTTGECRNLNKCEQTIVRCCIPEGFNNNDNSGRCLDLNECFPFSNIDKFCKENFKAAKEVFDCRGK